MIVNLCTYAKLTLIDYKVLLKAAQKFNESKKLKKESKEYKQYINMQIYQIVKLAQKSYVPPRERLILKLCGIAEKDVQTSVPLIQCGIYLWRAIKQYVWMADDQMAYSAVRTSIFLIKNGQIAYRYGTPVSYTHLTLPTIYSV